jgi:hypothetical protein
MAKRVGRPSKWETHVLPFLDRIPKLRKQGFHEAQIAKHLGVGYATFMEYKNRYPDLTEALKKGKTELIEDLEDTLYRKALGLIKTKDIKKYIKKTKNGEETRIEETIKEYAPDTGALVFSLKNLAPDKWKDRRDYEMDETSTKDFVDSIDKLITNIKTRPAGDE